MSWSVPTLPVAVDAVRFDAEPDDLSLARHPEHAADLVVHRADSLGPPVEEGTVKIRVDELHHLMPVPIDRLEILGQMTGVLLRLGGLVEMIDGLRKGVDRGNEFCVPAMIPLFTAVRLRDRQPRSPFQLCGLSCQNVGLPGDEVLRRPPGSRRDESVELLVGIGQPQRGPPQAGVLGGPQRLQDAVDLLVERAELGVDLSGSGVRVDQVAKLNGPPQRRVGLAEESDRLRVRMSVIAAVGSEVVFQMLDDHLQLVRKRVSPLPDQIRLIVRRGVAVIVAVRVLFVTRPRRATAGRSETLVMIVPVEARAAHGRPRTLVFMLVFVNRRAHGLAELRAVLRTRPAAARETQGEGRREDSRCLHSRLRSY